MDTLSLTARFKIRDGASDTFRTIASKCIEAVRKNEMNAGCLRYEWFYSADYSQCDVLETYTGSEAVLKHMANVGPFLQELLAISELSGTLYGTPSETLKKAFEGLDVEYLHRDAGM
jgi:quinol monooxygenase YgiN